MPNDTTETLSQSECDDLRRIAGIMVPASAEFAVPGADDPVIFADILKSLGRDLAAVRRALADLSTLAGGVFATLDDNRVAAVAETFLAQESPALTALGRAIAQCYYRDDRVMLSLGIEPRPPFPKGHPIEQGVWSLLDPVRARPPMWREAGA